ncbi:acyl-CoA thioesterase [Fictibacillus halophilus]|uniref:acyl-CoA thioesterase n=1 Tax=Fictibacillus halophilus TaxID=1610490 RepID=UPI001CFB8B56|nr:thioesterase family protein [Fictibacillus halophilus]
MARQDYISNMEEWKKGFHFFHELNVRFGEIDGFGHVNNTNVFIYMEEARIALFKELGLMRSWGARDSEEIPVVADLQCDYLAQIMYDEKLKVYVKIYEAGSSSIDLHYLGINEENKPVFTGRGAIVQISRESGRPLKWSETLKKQLENFSQKAHI